MIITFITRHFGPAIIAAASITKGLVMGTISILVVEATGLTSFQKALIIAIVSASITGLYTVIAALVAVRRANEIHRDVTDVKKALEIDKRAEDEN